MNHRDAECLYAWWKNRGLLKKSPYHVSNQCSEYGKVVAKVDLVSASDRTIHLGDDIPRDGDTRHRIRGISCCSDMGICNRSDILSDAGCARQFERGSSAAGTCRNATATYSSENASCTISAECRTLDTPVLNVTYNPTRITVPVMAVDQVKNCDGWLRPGACDFSPPVLSVSNAEVREAEGATLDFAVTLNRPIRWDVSVMYSTSSGTARPRYDYRPRMGHLNFAPGETEKTVSVSVLDDDLDEGPETMWLTLNFQTPGFVQFAQQAGMGTILNTDRIPKAWIARFGRAVADQVLDAVDDRMRAKPAPGVGAQFAGQRIGPGPAFAAGPQGDPMSGEAEASGPGRPVSGRALLPGSSFSLTAETGDRGLVSVWGRGAATGFSSRGDGVSFDGEVASGLLGADWTRGGWAAGLAVSHSRGDGAYRGAGGGTASATLTGLWPWVGHSLGERLSVWGVAGYGDGSLTLEPRAEDGTRAAAIGTGLDLMMAAAGLRGVALDGGEDGLTLAVKTDAMIVRTASDAVSGPGGNLAAAEAEITRLRLGLEGSRPFRLADDSVLTPSMEIGLRHDGGDAGTGVGADIGAGLAWTDPERGLGLELHGRALLIHESRSFRRRGIAGGIFWDPAVGGRGPRLSLTRTLGRSAPGAADGPPGPGMLPLPAAGESGDDLRDRRLEARFGYGFGAFGDRFTATPEIAVGLSNAARDYSLGCRLVRDGAAAQGRALELGLEARRRETSTDRTVPPEHAIGLRLTSRF